MGDLISREDDAKVYLQITGPGSDVLLDWLIKTAEGQIKMALGTRTLLQTTHTDELIDGSGTCELALPNFPIASVSALKIASDQDFTGATNQSAPDDFLIMSEAGLLVRKGGLGSFLNDVSPGGAVWPKGHENIQLTFQAGYVTIPNDIILATCMQVAYLRDRSNQVKGGQSHNEISSERVGDRQTSHHSELSRHGLCEPAWRLLRPYSSWT